MEWFSAESLASPTGSLIAAKGMMHLMRPARRGRGVVAVSGLSESPTPDHRPIVMLRVLRFSSSIGTYLPYVRATEIEGKPDTHDALFHYRLLLLPVPITSSVIKKAMASCIRNIST